MFKVNHGEHSNLDTRRLRSNVIKVSIGCILQKYAPLLVQEILSAGAMVGTTLAGTRSLEGKEEGALVGWEGRLVGKEEGRRGLFVGKVVGVEGAMLAKVHDAKQVKAINTESFIARGVEFVRPLAVAHARAKTKRSSRFESLFG
jgi:hypothetical protein